MRYPRPQKPTPYLDDPDVILMQEFQQGNPASFEKLLQKYYPRLLNFICRLIGNKETAEDLTQEVFIRVYKSAFSYNPRAQFQTWIYTIAKNTALNELRRPQRGNVSLEDELKIQPLTGKESRPDYEILREEQIAVIQAAINSLPPQQRLAVILRRYEDFSYEEIAQTLNCSLPAVKSFLNRAKENLKDKLSALLEGEIKPSR